MEIEVFEITEWLKQYCKLFEDWHIYYQTICGVNYNLTNPFIETNTKTFLKTNLSMN